MSEMEHLAGLVLDSLIAAVVVHDQEGGAILANAQAVALLGREASALSGLHPREYLSANPEAAREVEERLARALREGGVCERHRFSLDAGGRERTLCDWPFTVRDPNTGTSYAVILLEDSTESDCVESELRHRMAELQTELDDHHEELDSLRELHTHSEKMAALGDLLAGVAHEINTPLGAINSNHDTFVRAVVKMREAAGSIEGEPRQVLERFLSVIEELNRVNADAIQRILRIVGGLRNFARREEPILEEVKIHERIEDSLALIHHQVKNRIEVVREYDTDIPPICCYAGLLSQVLLNILVNAVHAIDDKGKITVRTSRTNGDIRIDITDSGRGISPESLGRIFEPGFTTKQRGRGTGLGLSISRQIVERHNGRIEVASEVGKGCTFSIILPLKGADECGGGRS